MDASLPSNKRLFEPFKIKNVQFKHRILRSSIGDAPPITMARSATLAVI